MFDFLLNKACFLNLTRALLCSKTGLFFSVTCGDGVRTDQLQISCKSLQARPPLSQAQPGLFPRGAGFLSQSQGEPLAGWLLPRLHPAHPGSCLGSTQLHSQTKQGRRRDLGCSVPDENLVSLFCCFCVLAHLEINGSKSKLEGKSYPYLIPPP